MDIFHVFTWYGKKGLRNCGTPERLGLGPSCRERIQPIKDLHRLLSGREEKYTFCWLGPSIEVGGGNDPRVRDPVRDGHDEWHPGPQSVDSRRGSRVSDDFNNFDRLGLGRMGQNTQERVPLVLFQERCKRGKRETEGWVGSRRGTPRGSGPYGGREP